MGRQILTTLGWTIIVFVIQIIFYYFEGTDSWLVRSLAGASTLGVGYFFGYWQARKDNKI